MTSAGVSGAGHPGIKPPRVAVIAVHGVGSPPADATAKSVAELLMRSPPDGVEYTWAEERRVTIPTNKVDTGDRKERGLADRLRRAFTSHASDRTNLGVSATDFENSLEVAHRPDVAFMRKLLRGYQSSKDPYSSVEMIGDRRVAGQLSADVHVFEMHWADLTRVGTGFARLVGTLYQLVQHISHIGRTTVDIGAQVAEARERLSSAAKARLQNATMANASPHMLHELKREAAEADSAARAAGPSSAWTAYSWVYSWVMRTFTVLVPVASVLMLAFVVLFLPAAVKPEWRHAAGLTLSALILTVIGAVLIYVGVDRKRAASLFVFYMLGIIAWTIWAGTGTRNAIEDGTWLLGWTVTLLTLGAYVALVLQAEKTRSGAQAFGLVALAGVAVIALVKQQEFGGLTFADPQSLRTFAFVGFQLSYGLLTATWGLLWLSILAAVVCRLLLRWLADRAAVDLVKRAVWTARVTLGAAVFGFLIALLVGYRSFVYLAEKATGKFNVFPLPLPGQDQLPVVPLPSLPPAFWCTAYTGGKWKCAEAFFIDLIGRSGTSGFVLAMIGLALVAALSSWFIVLIALTAIRTPKSTKGGSSRLGSWMTSGFVWLRRAGSVLAWSLLFAILVGVAIDYWPAFGAWARSVPWTWLARKLNTAWTAEVVGQLSIAVLASAATIGAARLRVETLAKRTRPALGVVLDVDNYLRESPENATPRAKIAERFVSLLRYLEKRGEFDRIVLVAHSQGTIIAADLLRFLSLGLEDDSPDRRLIKPDRYRLLTMGSPLRQLYGANFPHLYAWVTATDPSPLAPRTPLAAGATPDIGSKSPDPADLRVDRWVNLYTSGDYIGRNLWSDDDWDSVWEPREQAIVGGARRERCLGSGTHTRYWTSAEVAQELDELIAT